MVTGKVKRRTFQSRSFVGPVEAQFASCGRKYTEVFFFSGFNSRCRRQRYFKTRIHHHIVIFFFQSQFRETILNLVWKWGGIPYDFFPARFTKLFLHLKTSRRMIIRNKCWQFNKTFFSVHRILHYAQMFPQDTRKNLI